MATDESQFGGSPRRTSRPGLDVALLTALIALLVAIPSILIVGPLGAAGTPAEIMGLVMLVIWIYRRILSNQFGRSLHSVRVVLLFFAASVFVSYLAAATRPIDSLELNGADRGVLSMLAWLGIAFFMMDGPESKNQLDTVLRRLTIAGAVEASVGLIQLFTHLSVVTYLQIPGLTANADLAATLSVRGNETRPPGTTIHPIEFGAVLTMILPLALHYALNDRHRTKFRRWLPVFLIAFAIPASISRTAVLSAIVALVVLVPTWPAAIRRRAYVAMIGLFGCVYLTVPGLLGTIRSLFSGVSSDSSAASRTGSYDLAESLIRRAPWFGRGYATFLPKYRILDNQLLLTAIEGGLIGLAVLLALLITPIVASFRLRRRSADPQVRQLAVALAAGVAAAGCSFAFYDALAFPMATSILFMLCGAVGCLIRLTRTSAEPSQRRYVSTTRKRIAAQMRLRSEQRARRAYSLIDVFRGGGLTTL